MPRASGCAEEFFDVVARALEEELFFDPAAREGEVRVAMVPNLAADTPDV
ncbi:hypothetical protein GCM10025777_41900 [Membranihabitans marinus]|uniref:Uncharacterized protein n=1 Tax=Nesterenkonia rhizosphaerae TaxID=1348272 RepID=A0ABP9FZ07_9MICC